MNIITLAHGSGGQKSSNLIKEIFQKSFDNPILNQMNDAAIVEHLGTKIAFTTDSFVVKPLFFKGGDIGKIAVCGTINDLSMSGAKPLALSCGFIIEEGFDVEKLQKIVETMKQICQEVGVNFVTGDTKVVNKGAVDQIFINTSGIGIVESDINISGSNVELDDVIIVSGNIGQHEAAIMLEREDYGLEGDIYSDVAPLNGLVSEILNVTKNVHTLRDITRGGLGTVLNEIAEQSNVGIEVDETQIPIDNKVKGLCNILGLDPIYFACEGRCIVIVPKEYSNDVLSVMRKNKYGENSSIIGIVRRKLDNGRVYMKTSSGGSRIINKLIGDFLPRIC